MLNEEEQLILLLTNGLFDVWIQVLDPVTGSVIQQVRHDDPDFRLFGVEILETEEGYVLMGRKRSGSYIRIFAWKLDKDFNILKEVVLEEGNYNHIYVEALVDSDGNIVMLTNQHLGEFDYWRSAAIKFDPDLDAIWTTPVGDPQYHEEFSLSLIHI